MEINIGKVRRRNNPRLSNEDVIFNISKEKIENGLHETVEVYFTVVRERDIEQLTLFIIKYGNTITISFGSENLFISDEQKEKVIKAVKKLFPNAKILVK
ncbi:MAG: hypothetical protein ABF741_01565 [Liquorilactobacillus ghanensis]|uniref:hypothetical protein n=1 Tax=Liquorilactobacillus ghanensis TaxID=399370 RepID=UPI0039E8EB1E